MSKFIIIWNHDTIPSALYFCFGSWSGWRLKQLPLNATVPVHILFMLKPYNGTQRLLTWSLCDISDEIKLYFLCMRWSLKFTMIQLFQIMKHSATISHSGNSIQPVTPNWSSKEEEKKLFGKLPLTAIINAEKHKVKELCFTSNNRLAKAKRLFTIFQSDRLPPPRPTHPITIRYQLLTNTHTLTRPQAYTHVWQFMTTRNTWPYCVVNQLAGCADSCDDECCE